MGSFNQNCAISGLPIGSGDKLRYLLLVENDPRCGSDGVRITDWWAPRTFPLKGEYMDCGDPEHCDDGIQRDIWVKGFMSDLVEHGTGDNSYHDKATIKSELKFEDISDLIHESVLFVEREPGAAERATQWKLRVAEVQDERGEDCFDPTRVPGIPSLVGVRNDIIAAGFTVAGARGGGDYLVNELTTGDVTIRRDGYGNDEKAALEKLVPVLGEYQVVWVTGSNSVVGGAPMLRLFPKLGTAGFSGFDQVSQRGKWSQPPATARIAKAFIREDVWQSLIAQGVDGGCTYEGNPTRAVPKPRITIEDYVADARAVYDGYVDGVAKWKAYNARCKAENEARAANPEAEAALSEEVKTERRHAEWDEHRELYRNAHNFFSDYWQREREDDLRTNAVMPTLDKGGENSFRGHCLEDQFKLFVAANPSEAEVDAFLRVVAETAMVCTIMRLLWKRWTPSYYNGQDTNLEEHAAYLSGLAQVAQRLKQLEDWECRGADHPDGPEYNDGPGADENEEES